MKTSELQGAALDWAVAECENVENQGDGFIWFDDYDMRVPYTPSTDWAIGGPIIEREGIDCVNAENIGYEEKWMSAAPKRFGSRGEYVFGPTPLIAAMRCYVASKLGDEVTIPEELK